MKIDACHSIAAVDQLPDRPSAGPSCLGGRGDRVAVSWPKRWSLYFLIDFFVKFATAQCVCGKRVVSAYDMASVMAK